jgi:hypothetical protein
VSRPMPDRSDADDDLMSRLVFEARDPTIEPRPGHVAELRVLILSRLGPPRSGWLLRTRLLVVAAVAAACLVAVLAWPQGGSKGRAPGASGQQPPGQIVTRPREDPTSITAWGNVRRDLNLAEMPGFSWPLQKSSCLSRSTSIPADLLD